MEGENYRLSRFESNEQGGLPAPAAREMRTQATFFQPHRPLPPLPPLPPLLPRPASPPIDPRRPGSPAPRVSVRASSPPALRPPRAPLPPPLPPKSADAMSLFAVRALHGVAQGAEDEGKGDMRCVSNR